MSTTAPSPAGSIRERVLGWLDDRLGLEALGAMARKKEVPVHRHTFWYYLGGMTLFLFVVQVGTGILLLFYYRPSAAEAYESVQFLMTEVKFGWLIRSIHAWAANLLIFTLYLHMLSVLLLRAYRPPREATWMTGMVLLGLALGFGFTGYLLPWNKLAYFATRVGTQIVGSVPVVGSFLLKLLRGGEDVTGATLTRFYAIHAALLPALLGALLGVHLYLVQKHGMSVPAGVEARGGARGKRPFLPNFLLRDLVGWLAALAIVAALAAYFPAELGEKADPFASAPAGIRPEWYFMFLFQTLKLLPAHILGIEGEVVGTLGSALAAAFLFLMPFIDRRRKHGETNPVITTIGIGIIAYMIVLTYLGYTASVTQ
ncbi:MAG TPA: cytochrome bc complex cytochrome b subunit [Gemmatimonadota bacterium]|nr:cytochrome bc complex cytochrome b subunit [Gemmatimonadota bacterium]